MIERTSPRTTVPEQSSALLASDDAHVAELRRIREAYARRKHAIPPKRYSELDPVYSFQWREVKTRVSRVLRARNSLPLGDRRVFDVGCGDGRWLRALSEFGAAPQCLAGIDLLPERINAARELCSPLTNLYNGDATKLPFVDESFDLLLSFSLFSSILARVTKISLATQMMRVLRPGGFILWHDFCVNNPRNHDVGGIRRREVAELFRGARVELERITLAPPLARSVARSHGLLKTFSNFRFLCTHYFGTIEKR